MKKWEYARMLLGSGGRLGERVALTLYTGGEVSHATMPRVYQTDEVLDLADKHIAKLGNEGWELVAVRPIIEQGHDVATIFWFKRRAS